MESPSDYDKESDAIVRRPDGWSPGKTSPAAPAAPARESAASLVSGRLGFRAPKDHVNIRILQTMISSIPLNWALDPER